MKRINFTSRLSDKTMLLPHVLEHTVGNGHATLTLRADWQTLTVLVTNHALPRHPLESESMHVELEDISPQHTVYIERIENEHANANQLWIDMGKPTLPTEREVEQLHVASKIVRGFLPWKCDAGTLYLEFTMPPPAIAAITVELSPEQHARKPRS